jgi:protein-tyrosine phosphatase
MTDKAIGLDRVVNFRDLGGAPTVDGRRVRRHMLYRSGSLHEMTDRDRARLEGAGIGTVIDLRCDWERHQQPYHWPGVDAVAAPFIDDDAVIEMMRRFEAGTITSEELEDWWHLVRVFRAPEEQVPSMRIVCETLLASTSGVVVHCRGGKDRTGMVAAFLLDAMGVHREAVMADFLRSNEVPHDDRMQRQIAAMVARVGPGSFSERAIASLAGVRSEWLDRLFAQVEGGYGSVAGYLARRVGIGEEGVSLLRHRYLEPE